MNQEELKKYCELIIEVGVNLYPEQCLNINCGIKNYEFALLLAETAYKKGAKFVDFKTGSSKLTKNRIQ